MPPLRDGNDGWRRWFLPLCDLCVWQKVIQRSRELARTPKLDLAHSGAPVQLAPSFCLTFVTKPTIPVKQTMLNPLNNTVIRRFRVE
jgi:hypothetical protein